MKKTLLIAVLSLLVFASCNKYPEGPKLSLRTKKERLANSWRVTYYSENGVDKTTDFNNTFVNYNIVIEKSGNYTVTYRFLNVSDYVETGTWDFISSKSSVLFNPSSPSSADDSSWELFKLKETELWAKTYNSQNNITTEVHLIPL